MGEKTAFQRATRRTFTAKHQVREQMSTFHSYSGKTVAKTETSVYPENKGCQLDVPVGSLASGDCVPHLLHQRPRSKGSGLHCFDLSILSVDVNPSADQVLVWFLTARTRVHPKCHRSEGCGSEVHSLSSSTPGSVATQHQRSATILTRSCQRTLHQTNTLMRMYNCCGRHGCENFTSQDCHMC